MALYFRNSGTNKVEQAVELCCKLASNQTIPMAKHPGFTAPIAAFFIQIMQNTASKISTRWKHYQSSVTVRRMLDLDDAILCDMNLTRSDLNYVLRSRSAIDPTTRLRLLSVQRRSQTRLDQRRRANYLSSLVPAPYNGKTCDKSTKDQAKV